MREFKRTEWVNVNGIGLLPEHRGVGANAVLYTEMAKSVQSYREQGYTRFQLKVGGDPGVAAGRRLRAVALIVTVFGGVVGKVGRPRRLFFARPPQQGQGVGPQQGVLPPAPALRPLQQ